MLLRLLRYMRGYVRFTVSGKYPERFLNITARRGVRLWSVERHGEGFCACMYRADYRAIRPLARGAGVCLKVNSKHGLPQLASRYRSRAGIVLGGCAFVLTVFVMSLFVWSIDITGLSTYSESHIRDILRDKGLYVGAFKPSVDAVSLADSVMIENSGIGWMAVNLCGSYASVEVKEKAIPPVVGDVVTPCNVKARCDGLIVSVEAGEGTVSVQEGSAVVRGQLLVSGVMENADGGSRLVHASAKIKARTTHEAEFTVPEHLTLMKPTGETAERYSVRLFGLSVPCNISGVDSPYTLPRELEEAPSPLGVQLPIGRVTERISAIEPEEIRLNENSAKELLEHRSVLYEVFSLSKCTVEARDFDMEYKDGSYTLHVTYTCIEDIAKEEEIGVGEVY